MVRRRSARTLVALTLSYIASVGPASADGPFGFEMGSQLSKYGPAEPLKQPGLYKFSQAPRTHPAFELYVLKHHPETGICMIRAIGQDIVTSSFGSQIRDEFSNIREQLSSVYGKSGINDFLKSGSIWSESRYWMMSLLKTDRVLQAHWDRKSGAALKDGISEILLSAAASSDEKGYIVLQYRFSNELKCDQLLKKDAAKAF